MSLERMQLRLLQLLDNIHLALDGSLLEQDFEVGSIPYRQVSVFNDDQSQVMKGAFARCFESIKARDTCLQTRAAFDQKSERLQVLLSALAVSVVFVLVDRKE